MNAPDSPSFRGARAIADVLARARPLADHLQAFHPSCKVITISRRDLATLRRYPEAAQIHYNVVTAPDGTTYWRDFELRPAKS